ncbi:hypothetical protein CBL_10357 [Carabus blaptoides fortunei]
MASACVALNKLQDKNVFGKWVYVKCVRKYQNPRYRYNYLRSAQSVSDTLQNTGTCKNDVNGSQMGPELSWNAISNRSLYKANGCSRVRVLFPLGRDPVYIDLPGKQICGVKYGTLSGLISPREIRSVKQKVANRSSGIRRGITQSRHGTVLLAP